MTGIVRSAGLTHYCVANDGSEVRLGMTGADGAAFELAIAADAVSRLVMTLPTVLRQMLVRQYRDDSLRVVYPLCGWSVEVAPDGQSLILTLGTNDGFTVSFGTNAAEIEAIADTAGMVPPPGARAN
ncbi:MAG: hypothetical protein AB7K86_26070 [Rhodospirillales bacterium]